MNLIEKLAEEAVNDVKNGVYGAGYTFNSHIKAGFEMGFIKARQMAKKVAELNVVECPHDKDNMTLRDHQMHEIEICTNATCFSIAAEIAQLGEKELS